MTVAELIKLLVDMPMNAEVLIHDKTCSGNCKAVPVTCTVNGKKRIILCHIESEREEDENDRSRTH